MYYRKDAENAKNAMEDPRSQQEFQLRVSSLHCLFFKTLADCII